MFKTFKYLPILMLLFASSCKKDLPTIGGTAAQNLANEWWVTLTLNGVDQYGTHKKIETSNTSANDNTIWVDDFGGNVWQFQAKAVADFTNLTFSANQSASSVSGYNIKVDITDGKVLPNLGRSKSGNVVDSIYMKIKFSDDPGNVYVLSGHARTKFIEDEY